MSAKDTQIPKHEIEALARCLLPEIQKFFESENGQKEFANWKDEQTKKILSNSNGRQFAAP